MDFSGLKDLKYTIPGIVILIGITVALLKGACTFDQWWTVVLFVLGSAGAGALLMAKGKDKPQ